MALPRFVLLYGALFTGFGAASPFLPSLLQEGGLGPNGLAVALACGTAVRLLAGPAGCRLADRLGLRRRMLTILTAGAAAVGLGYLLPGGFPILLLASVLHAALLALMVPLADALAVEAVPKRYGWVRGAGSAAFILGSSAAGQAVAEFGLPSLILLNAGLVAWPPWRRRTCRTPSLNLRACDLWIAMPQKRLAMMVRCHEKEQMVADKATRALPAVPASPHRRRLAMPGLPACNSVARFSP